ncbi:MAG TPA: hypothetical protein VGX76_13155 [Pirellulales bacterium]|nr:hypothetical protein [Pirellulales bacterium]
MSTKTKKSALSTGAIVAIVGGGVVATALVVGLIVWAGGSLGTSTPGTAATETSQAQPAQVVRLVGFAKDMAFTWDGSLIQTRINAPIGNAPQTEPIELFRFIDPATGDRLPLPPVKGQ